MIAIKDLVGRFTILLHLSRTFAHRPPGSRRSTYLVPIRRRAGPKRGRLDLFVERFVCGAPDVPARPSKSPLVHSKHQVVMIVVRARRTRRRASQVAELRSYSLQAARGKSECCRQTLRSSLGGHNRLDKDPRGTVGVGRIVKVESVGGIAAP